jgi:hypothetical protein
MALHSPKRRFAAPGQDPVLVPAMRAASPTGQAAQSLDPVFQTAGPQTPVYAAPRVEINRLYTKYNPEKLPDVDVLVAKYGEVKLLAMMCKKYAAQEKAAGGAPAGASAISATFPEPG